LKACSDDAASDSSVSTLAIFGKVLIVHCVRLFRCLSGVATAAGTFDQILIVGSRLVTCLAELIHFVAADAADAHAALDASTIATDTHTSGANLP
jgi:hypothetical protein